MVCDPTRLTQIWNNLGSIPTEGNKKWFYETTDSEDTCAALGYFDAALAAGKNIQIGDWIDGLTVDHLDLKRRTTAVGWTIIVSGRVV